LTDHLSKKDRSYNMSRIRSRHTKPELILRSLLHRAGFRFRIKNKHLPGNPDIVLAKYRTIIFVHGCFWHRHQNCKRATMPKSNQSYWQEKFERNIQRDKEVKKQLSELNWQVIVAWECEIKADPVGVLKSVVSKFSGNIPQHVTYDMDRSEILKIAEKKQHHYFNQ